MSDEMPEGKPTVKFAEVPPWAIELTQSVKGGFARQDERFDSVDVRLDGLEGADKTLANKVQDMSVDIRQLRDADVRHEEQFRRLSMPQPAPLTSERVREVVDVRASAMNLEQDARIALLLASKDEEIAKLRAESATKEDIAKALDAAAKAQTVAIVEGVKELAKTPTAQKLKNALVPVLMIAIAIIGIKLTAMLAKLEAAPPQPVQQLAPTVIYVDAGADK